MSTNNTYFSLAALKASAVSEGTAFLVQDASVVDGTFFWALENFTGKADNKNIIQSDNEPLTVGAWLRQTSNSVAFTVQSPDTVTRSVQSRLRETLSAADFGAVGDYDFDTDTGTDNTAALQAAIDAMVAQGPNSPSVLDIPSGYYKITAPLNFPIYFERNIINGNGSMIVYRGAVSSTNAIFRFAHTGQIKNTFNDLMLRCEDRAAYAIDVRGASGNIVFAENVFNNIEILAPTVHAVRIGDYLTSGFDVDGACNTFKQLRMRLKTGQGGVYLDALNIFNVTFFSPFFGGWGDSKPNPYLTVKNGAGLYLYDVFTGDNAEGRYAFELEDGNVGIFGWNTEGTALLKMQGFIGERRNVLVENVLVNDSVSSTVATDAIHVVDGHLTIASATLGKSNFHPRNIRCEDALVATNIYLGRNETTGAFGSYILTHPERCIIEGVRPPFAPAINGNTRMDLWTGSAANDLPWGYFKPTAAGSPVGAATVTQSTQHVTNGNFTARIEVTNGALSGQMCAGLAAHVPIAYSPASPANSRFVAVVRGHAEDLVGATTVNVRLTFKDQYDNPVNSGASVQVQPDGAGNFLAILTGAPADLTALYASIGVGLSETGATGKIWWQDCTLYLMDTPTINAGANFKGTAAAWSQPRPQVNMLADYAKVGVTARMFGHQTLRAWLGTGAPASGTYVRGDEVVSAAPGIGDPNGWRCVAAGTPGTWKAYGALYN